MNFNRTLIKIKQCTGETVNTNLRGGYWIYWVGHVLYFFAVNVNADIENIQTWKPGSRKKPVKHVTIGGAINYIEDTRKIILL